MSAVALVTDSTAYLPPELVRRYRIRVVPLYVRFGEEVFRDGVDMTPEMFYARLPTAPVMPATSQPSPADFITVYRELVEQGASAILSVHISSKLSGTVASAELARQEVPEVPIQIVDSLSLSMGLGILVLEAAWALEAGRPVEEIAQHLERLREQIRILFVVDTLEFLRRGGRIGGAQAFLGSMLSLKPILTIREGHVDAVERVRTKQRAIRRMVEMLVQEAAGRPIHLAVIHASVPAEANLLLEQARGQLNVRETFTAELSPVIGTHAGPGTIGMMVCPSGEE